MAVNTIKQRPVEPILTELASKGFDPLGPLCIAIRDLITRADKTANNNGEIQAKANISGRTEQLSTTLQNVEATGNFNSLANVNDTSTNHLTDGTGSPLTGGKRGFVALDTNNRLAGTFRNNLTNVNYFFTGANPLSQVGTSTAIAIASSTIQYGDGQVSYNSGSVDPGGYGTFRVYCSDPTFAGGAVTYQVSSNNSPLTATNGVVFIGIITTSAGGGGTGSGNGDSEPNPGLR